MSFKASAEIVKARFPKAILRRVVGHEIDPVTGSISSITVGLKVLTVILTLTCLLQIRWRTWTSKCLRHASIVGTAG